MRTIPILFLFVGAIALTACGKKKADPKPSTPTNWALRQSLQNGEGIAPPYLDKLTREFAEQITGLNEAEAKSCRVEVYLSSLHYKNKSEESFDGDFRQAGRNAGETARLSLAYEAFDRIVRKREKEEAEEKLRDATTSIRQQVLSQGKFYTSSAPLAICRFEGIPHDDIALPYFNIHCEDAETGAERLAQQEQYEKTKEFCARLQAEFLDHGEVDEAIISESPLR